MWMRDENGDILKDPLGKKYWIDDFLKSNFDYIMPRVSNKIAHRRSDMFIIIDGPVGCLTEDTLIQTSNGPMKLSNLKLKETSLKSFDFETNKEVIGKGAVIPSGKKEVFEIETEDGRKVQATAEHRFFVKRNGKVIELHLNEIKEGDESVCQ